MSTEDQFAHHRTFLSEFRCQRVFEEELRYQNRSHYPNGVPGRAQRMARDTNYRTHVQHCRAAGVGYTGAQGRQFQAFILRGQGLEPIAMRQKADQSFAEYATPWEQKWSTLCFGFREFTPIVNDDLTVVAHHGYLLNNSRSNLIVGRDAFPDKTVRADRPKVQGVVLPPTYEYVGASPSEISEAMRRGATIFVYPRTDKPPIGWIHLNVDIAQVAISVTTTLDGEVRHFQYKMTGYLQSVDPVSFTVGIVFVQLVKYGLRKIAALESRKRRNVFEGPTATTAVGAAKIYLRLDEAVLAVISKDGKILARTPATGVLSHEKFIVDTLGKNAIKKNAAGKVELADHLKGAEVVTIGRLDRNIVAFNSRTFHGNELPASRVAQDAVRKEYH